MRPAQGCDCCANAADILIHAKSIAYTIVVCKRAGDCDLVWQHVHKCVYCRSCHMICVRKYEDVLMLTVHPTDELPRYICNKAEDVISNLNEAINKLDVRRLALRCAGEFEE